MLGYEGLERLGLGAHEEIEVMLLYAGYSRAMATNAQSEFETPHTISVEEYLPTAYSPDCDYVDGRVEERNSGEFDHASIQAILCFRLRELAQRLSIRVLPELRMRVSRTRFRIPDVCVMLKSQKPERVPTTPPFLCIEIVSSDDRMSRLMVRVKEYLAFGVTYVWVIDPQSRTGYVYTKDEGREVRDCLTTANPDISISLSELFAELD